MTDTRENITNVAERFGIDLTAEQISQLGDTFSEFDTRLNIFNPDSPSHQQARNVRDGEDLYNAFLYEFELSTQDGNIGDLSVAVKDNIAVSGVPMTCGSAHLEFEPDYHATAVNRLVNNGASVIGTTNMDDFAYHVTGETCAHGPITNPRVEQCVPGGSSAGSGAAVAAGLADGALGSDTGGSVRIPAAWCGVVGFKPTHRLVSRFGFADLSPTLDHIGTLADDVETASRLLDVMAGPDPLDPTTDRVQPAQGALDPASRRLTGRTVGLVEEAFRVSEPRVAETVERVVDALRAAGIELERVSIPGFEEAGAAVEVICGAEFTMLLDNGGQAYTAGTGYIDGWRQALKELVSRADYGENVRNQLVLNGTVMERTGGSAYVAAQNTRSSFIETLHETFEDLDGLITPTTPMAAPPFGAIQSIDDFLHVIANTASFNLSGHPAISIPCGTLDEKPVGLQVITNWHEESLAAAIGMEIEGHVSDS